MVVLRVPAAGVRAWTARVNIHVGAQHAEPHELPLQRALGHRNAESHAQVGVNTGRWRGQHHLRNYRCRRSRRSRRLLAARQAPHDDAGVVAAGSDALAVSAQ